jgi:hypothetical protein
MISHLIVAPTAVPHDWLRPNFTLGLPIAKAPVGFGVLSFSVLSISVFSGSGTYVGAQG